MSEYSRFRNTDIMPSRESFYDYILCKVGEAATPMTRAELEDKLKEDEMEFIVNFPYPSIIQAKVDAVNEFTKHGYVFQLRKNEDKFREAKKAHDAKTYELQRDFLEQLKEDFDIYMIPNADKIVQHAWQESKSEGFDAVANTLEEIVDIIPTDEISDLVRASDALLKKALDVPSLHAETMKLMDVLGKFTGNK